MKARADKRWDRWTEAEDNILRSIYTEQGAEAVSKLTGRTPCAVEIRAYNIGVARKRQTEILEGRKIVNRPQGEQEIWREFLVAFEVAYHAAMERGIKTTKKDMFGPFLEVYAADAKRTYYGIEDQTRKKGKRGRKRIRARRW